MQVGKALREFANIHIALNCLIIGAITFGAAEAVDHRRKERAF
jgi:hypothetical protein